MDDNIPVRVTSAPASESPPGIKSGTLDWVLFGITVAGAAIVYISLFNGSWIGFVIGEVICGSIWIGGLIYKWKHGQKVRFPGFSRSGIDQHTP